MFALCDSDKLTYGQHSNHPQAASSCLIMNSHRDGELSESVVLLEARNKVNTSPYTWWSYGTATHARTHTRRRAHKHTCSHSNNGELVGTWKNPMYATIRLYGLLSQVKCFSAAHWRCAQTVSYGLNEARLIKAAFSPVFNLYAV